MCCEKCKEKVQEELEDMEGVRTVVCDQLHQRVTVAGFVDPLRVLKRVKKVKKKSEFFTQGSYISPKSPSQHRYTGQQDSVQPLMHPVHQDSVRYAGQPLVHPVHQDSVRYAGQPLMHPVHQDSVRYAGQDSGRYAGQGLTRTNSFGRERGLARQPSFGKVAHYEQHHDEPRDYYGVRRMPSFKKHRYHDAEYVSMGDEFHHHHHSQQQRPGMLQSQVSFSKLPVRNPHYVQPAYHEYV
jgi:copper chaperone CopZ